MAARGVVSACAFIMTVDKTSTTNCLGVLPNMLYFVVIEKVAVLPYSAAQ
jgi:hypothetical protein